MGGGVAIEVALSRPDLLHGLVLAGTGCRLPVSERILNGLENDYENTLDQVARYCLSKTVDPELFRRTRAEMGRCPPEVVRADFAACVSFNRCVAVRDIPIPTLVICGTRDVMTPLSSSEQLRDSIPNARLETIPEGSHMVMLEQPSGFNAILGRFLVLR
jgi:pimeloyl-ACP methyl ester carboxylesterase